MTKSELKQISSDFPDIKPLIIQNKELSGKICKIRRRLKTNLDNYGFLIDLVSIDSYGERLVNAVVGFFKAIGFDKVENIDKKYKEEDIRLWADNFLLIIEVTGIENRNPPFKKCHQISMHIPKRQSEYPCLKVFGLFVVNHDCKRHYSKREKKPFNSKISETAQLHNYTLATTLDLLNLFILFKNGTLCRNEILKKLCSTGEFKLGG
ncbi:MAG: hypothetical protein WCP69_14610 [Bacteroidota bacterium]